MQLKQEMQKLARIESVKSENEQLRELIKRVQSQISESLASKNDLQRIETKLMKYSNATFVTLEGNKLDNRQVIKAVERLESLTKAMLTDTEGLQTVTKQMSLDLKTKVH